MRVFYSHDVHPELISDVVQHGNSCADVFGVCMEVHKDLLAVPLEVETRDVMTGLNRRAIGWTK